MRGVMDGQLSIPAAVQSTDSTVRRSLYRAAMEGIKKAGLLEGDLTPAELTKIQNTIFNEQDYVVGLVEFAAEMGRKENPSYSEVFNRVDMWANRYDMVVDMFYTMASKNKKFAWKIGKTLESCVDCLAYNGRVYRGSIWDKYDIRPKMWDLTCRGGHCDCGLEETDEPVSRGFPPKPKGRAA
jgi:hypothetical protein